MNFEELANLVKNDDVIGLSRQVNNEALKGVDINGRSLLFLAAASNATDAGLYLIDTAKLDINALDNSGESALMRAAVQGNVPLIQGLLAGGAKLEQASPGTGGTALHSAYAGGQKATAAVAALVEAGADQAVLDKSGRKPDAWAAEGQAIDEAAKLLVNGEVVAPRRRAPGMGR